MTRTITNIRPVGIAPHLTLIADVKEDGCPLGYSVTIDQLTSEELTAYAVIEAAELEQENHKALQIVLDVTAPAWQIEAEARAADTNDWMQQTNELRNQ